MRGTRSDLAKLNWLAAKKAGRSSGSSSRSMRWRSRRQAAAWLVGWGMRARTEGWDAGVVALRAASQTVSDRRATYKAEAQGREAPRTPPPLTPNAYGLLPASRYLAASRQINQKSRTHAVLMLAIERGAVGILLPGAQAPGSNGGQELMVHLHWALDARARSARSELSHPHFLHRHTEFARWKCLRHALREGWRRWNPNLPAGFENLKGPGVGNCEMVRLRRYARTRWVVGFPGAREHDAAIIVACVGRSLIMTCRF